MTQTTVRYDVFDRPGHSPDRVAGVERPALTWPEQVAELVRRDGGRVAVVDRNRSLTYAQLWESGSRIAGGLVEAGCRPGDRVCIEHPNSVEWVELFLGTQLAGCVAVPLDRRSTDEHRAFVKENSGARLAFGADVQAPRGRPHVHDVTSSDVAVLLYTSGTTGTPKGVVLTHGNLASYSAITRAYLGREPSDEPFRNLIAIPLCHSAGCNTQLLPTLALGGTAVLAPGSGPTSILQMMEAWQPDLMFAVPVVFRRLIDATSDDRSVLRSLRDVHYGAATTPRTLVRNLRAALPWAKLGNAFGMTEISNVALFLPDAHIEQSMGSVGFPVPGVECQIRQPDESGVGELCLRGPNMAAGYWQRPSLTEDVFGSGWVRSGDMAEIGADGAVYLHDRKDDVINRGGEKVYSTSVEDALLELPGVSEAAVVGLHDEDLGSRVAAVLVAAEEYDVPRLRSLLEGKLPLHAIPERLITQSEPLPRGSSGKVLKRSVEDRFATTADHD
jgi:acyl-CoA synthetase (AMP-forming)/AMP-acid ligase II